MKHMMGLLVGVVVLCLLNVASAGDEICNSYAGGQVYPQETRRTSGHTIQWSQAVSECFF